MKIIPIIGFIVGLALGAGAYAAIASRGESRPTSPHASENTQSSAVSSPGGILQTYREAQAKTDFRKDPFAGQRAVLEINGSPEALFSIFANSIAPIFAEFFQSGQVAKNFDSKEALALLKDSRVLEVKMGEGIPKPNSIAYVVYQYEKQQPQCEVFIYEDNLWKVLLPGTTLAQNQSPEALCAMMGLKIANYQLVDDSQYIANLRKEILGANEAKKK